MRVSAVLVGLAFAFACKTAGAATSGVATYYHESLAGNLTANGEVYDPEAMTCAHRTLPFGTEVEIEVVATGKTTTCRINDRGPFGKRKNRIIDVSRAVAEELGFFGAKGVAKVRIRVLK